MKATKLDDNIVKILPEDEDDIWTLYNLVSIDDKVSASIFRKLAFGAKASLKRTEMNLEIKVQKLDYDRDCATLRLSGKIIMQGQFHTLEIQPKKPLLLTKSSWDPISVDMLGRSCNADARAYVAVLLISDSWLAQLFLIGGSVTKIAFEVRHTSHPDIGPERSFESTMKGVKSHVNFELVKCFVIASPDSTHQKFYNYLLAEAKRSNLKMIIESKAKFILAEVDRRSGQGLKDVLNNPSVMGQIKGTQIGIETKVLKDLQEMMRTDEGRTCYGPKAVEIAYENCAIESLLMTDEVFRSQNVDVRRKYIDMVESVKNASGSVNIFSSMHESGKELSTITGIAAILRFPLPELDELEM